MTRPATSPGWATDSTYNAPGEQYDGALTKIGPSAGERAQGFAPGQRMPAGYINDQLNLVGQWVEHLDGLLGQIDDAEARTLIVHPYQSDSSVAVSDQPMWAHSSVRCCRRARF